VLELEPLAVHLHLDPARTLGDRDGRYDIDLHVALVWRVPRSESEIGSLAGNVSATAGIVRVPVVDAEGRQLLEERLLGVASGTRSCGRRGPARLGSTVDRSSSTTCE
jgi:hypothetical protein